MLQFTYLNDDQRGDLVRSGGNLIEDFDLETAVLMSIFTDRRDEASPSGDTYRGGWWADEPGDQIGSRLWTLRREKATQSNVNLAKKYIEESLNWMLNDGVAESVTVATWRGQGVAQLRFRIEIERPGAEPWAASWERQLNEL